jgi:UDP-N-acetylglucosamine diphosphorylase/glucosamine-1-phosphate N-acetyltransferase
LRLFYFYGMSIPHIVLFDSRERNHLLPLTATRAVADIRVGILTIREKWEKYLKTSTDVLTQDYLQAKYPLLQKQATLYINAGILPNPELCREILQMGNNTLLQNEDCIIAVRTNRVTLSLETIGKNREEYIIAFSAYPLQKLNFSWDIFKWNGEEIRKDIHLLGLIPNPEKLSDTNQLLGKEIYVEEGVRCECSILNAQHGPIYLGKDSEVMEGCTIRGPFALGEYSTLKMQTKVYGDTSIGPHCKIGGEISNSVIFGYSNKAHDGFLGNSVIGEWCNLGADTNNSNLKNNYGKVKVWDYAAKDYVNSDLQFCGLIMGDHSKSSINTMFNTGTVAGVCANVFGAGFHPKFIRDFAWGVNGIFQLEIACEVAQRVMERRGIEITETDKKILKHIFEQTAEFRK